MKSKFLEDFKKFAMRGNVVDMAVGIIIGGAFGKIVSSLVADVIMQLSTNHAGLSDYLVLDLPADPPVEQIAGEKERGSARTGSSPRRRAVADRDPRSA